MSYAWFNPPTEQTETAEQKAWRALRLEIQNLQAAEINRLQMANEFMRFQITSADRGESALLRKVAAA